MLVTTATVGESFRNERSDSSASATMKSPLPRRAPEPRTPRRPPTTTVGSSPPGRAPWPPSRWWWSCRGCPPPPRRTSGASARPASPRAGSPGRPWRRASTTSGLSGLHRGRGHDHVRARHVRRRVAFEERAPSAPRRSVVGGALQVGARRRRSRGSAAPRRCRSCPSRRCRRSGRAGSCRTSGTAALQEVGHPRGGVGPRQRARARPPSPPAGPASSSDLRRSRAASDSP